MKICDYSSLIFAGNTTVLLIVSLTTDYWELRSIDKPKVLQLVEDKRGANMQVVMPFDTDSYFQVIVTSNLNCSGPLMTKSFYQVPLYLVQKTCKSFNASADNDGEIELLKYQELNFFEQYGNLFRDCDELEKDVRRRLRIVQMRPKKCTYFHNQWTSSNTHYDAPELNTIESLAYACAMICMICVTIGAASGAHGLFNRYTNGRTFYVASVVTLIAGFSLTLAIALFHGRCQVLKNMPLFPDHVFPFKNKLNKLRTYSFGWSFMLAWICVCFCYISSYVWLCKAQDSSRRYKMFGLTGQVLKHNGTQRLPSMVFMNFMKYRKVANIKEDIATV